MQTQVREFRHHLRLAFIVPLVLAALLGAAFVIQAWFLRGALLNAQHSYDVQTRARSVMRLILDMETGLRGYLLTGSESFLQPYRTSLPQVQPAFDQLAELVRDDPRQTQAQVAMQRNFEAWQNYAERMIVIRRVSGPVTDSDFNLEGKTLMDEIRHERDQILTIEEGRFQNRVRGVQRTVTTLFIMATVLCVAVGFVIATFSRRELSTLARTFNRTLVTAYERGEELQQSQSWLEGVLTSIDDGVIAADLRGRIVFSNNVAQALLNRSQSELNLAPVSETVHVIDEYTGEPLSDPFQSVVVTQARVTSSAHSLLLRHDDSRVPVFVAASPMRDESHALTGVVIVLRDETEHRQSERTLQSAEKMASIGRLAASVAHEIHNPLDSLGNILYLLEHGTLDEASKTYVRLAREELERVSNISEQMLTFSRESRQPVEVDLAEVIDNVLTLFAARIRRQGVVVVKNYQPSVSVLAFPGELRQVFSNLVGNALDAMPGTGRLTIRTRAARKSEGLGRDGARVLICDTGAGIPEEVRGRLMDPFVTSKGEKGTGLGLWVCRGIVEKYRGTLTYRTSTSPGRSGTCFSVFFPTTAQKAPVELDRRKAS
ncbi:MAG TPA: CHASE3 domain-containing protein [Terriglobales bacterium]|nr:CHASE3 domain-containing protein [Terriglobales bacterium]